jgi:hypothetical protein
MVSVGCTIQEWSNHMKQTVGVVVLCVILAAGCAKRYMTPGAGMDVSSIADARVREAMEAEPAASFPATVAIVRVQGSGYRSYSNASYGYGAFSVVTTRDIESAEDLERLSSLPDVAAMVPLNKLVIPRNLESSSDLRAAAASLKADLLLLYSIDTEFWVDKTNIGPLAAMMLGLAPKNRAYVSTTASAALLDTRTGFVYGLAEGNARDDKMANAWNKRASVEKIRLRIEAQAFHDLVDQLVTLWDEILVEHGSGQRTTAN